MADASNKPEPFSPADCDLRGYDYMPLYGHRLFSSTLYTESTDAEFRAALRLWWSAWQQCPAGSLPNSEAALAMLADYGRDLKGWQKVRAKALHGFVLCSDGRLYHPMLCEEAVRAYGRRLDSETKRETDRERLQRWRESKKKRVVSCDGNADETRFNTRFETPNVAVEREIREREDTSSLRSDAPSASVKPPDRPVASAVQPSLIEPDAPTALFTEGLATLGRLAGKKPDALRSVLGLLRKEIGNDCAALLALIRRADEERVIEPVAWLKAAIKARKEPPPPPQATTEAPRKDPWGIRAWMSRQPDIELGTCPRTKMKVPSINGFIVEDCAGDIADAAFLPECWRGNWDAMGEWLRDDIEITPEVLRTISAVARRVDAGVGSIALFDAAVRGLGLRVVAGREYG